MEIRTLHDDVTELQISQRQIVELPDEIHEYVIAFLDNWRDTATIAHCALVCRRWLRFSRFKLYYRIPLHYTRQWISFEQLVLHPNSSVEGYLGMVRELCVEPKNKIFDGEGTQKRIGWGKGKEQPWAHLVLVRCAARLTGLTNVRFVRVDWTGAAVEDLALSSGCCYRSLTTLELWHCRFSDVSQLHNLAAAFPALTRLSLSFIKFQSSTMFSPIPQGALPLTHLIVKSDSDVMPSLSEWLARAQWVRNLASLQWWFTSHEDGWKTVSDAIDGPVLQELEFHWHVRYDLQVDLSRFTCLRILRLTCQSRTLDEGLKSVNGVLSGISSSQLEEVVLLFNDNDRPHDSCSLDSVSAALAHLGVTDNILSGPHFARLRRVKLKLDPWIFLQPIPTPDGPVDPQSSPLRYDLKDPKHQFRLDAENFLTSAIEDKLKRLSSRGVLEIDLKIFPRPSRHKHGPEGFTTVSTPSAA